MSSRPRTALFGLTVFVGSGLLFLVEPMVAKMLLPKLGGTPAVWNTTMVFFQAALLGGYAYAHLSLRRLGWRRHPVVQVVVVAAVIPLLPIALPSGWRPPVQGTPSLWVLGVLALTAGIPFLVVATTGPTLQAWFTGPSSNDGPDPYFLYAASNAGSLIGLLSYPVLLEPNFALADQSRLWTAGYLVFAALTTACALVTRAEVRRVAHVPAGDAPATATGDRPTAALRARWVLFASVPSVLLLGVTRHLTTDVAAVPLLWVIPLCLYLVSFVVTFGRDPNPIVRVSARGLQLAAIPIALSFLGVGASLVYVLSLHLIGFFLAALLAHGRLSSERPAPRYLTEFYVWVSIGGVVGGLIAMLVAPLVFPGFWEYPLALAAALAFRPRAAKAMFDRGFSKAQRALLGGLFVAFVVAGVIARAPGGQHAVTVAALVLGVAGIGAYLVATSPKTYAACLGVLMAVSFIPVSGTVVTQRTFFGVNRVEHRDHFNFLYSGNTLHGMQDLAPGQGGVPLTYYSRSGPAGQVFAALSDHPARNVAVIGLGSGSLAAYGRPGDAMTFFEIDDGVRRIATDPKLFTFVGDSSADVQIVLGDGRLTLAREAAGSYDIVVLDAFGSDAIPTHLLTREALALYLAQMRSGGMLMVHITNRYVDLAPVVGRLAQDAGLTARVERYNPSEAELAAGQSGADWMVLARSEGDLASIATDARWQAVDVPSGTPVWTDTFSDVLRALRLS
ncbi:MAG: hypothetical protein QOI95_2649 [Acidimicrobiaceae bacterium]|jgi:hypothetical protein